MSGAIRRGETQMSTVTHTTTMKRRILLAVTAALLALMCALTGAHRASAAYSIEFFEGESTDTAGNQVTQAGAHPDVTTSFQTSGAQYQDASIKDVKVDFPAGLIVNPAATPRCSRADLSGQGAVSLYPGTIANCPPGSQVGVIYPRLNYGNFIIPAGPVAVYNVVPPPGVPGRFAANIIGVIVNLDATVQPGNHYAISAISRGTSGSLSSLQGADVTIWGVPNSPVHDSVRACKGKEFGPCSTTENARPQVSAPSDCSAGLLSTNLTLNSWQEPDLWKTASFDHDRKGNPIVATGCEQMHFNPKLTLRPQSRQASSPTAVDVNLQVPQSTDPEGLSTALLDNATVTLPKGMAVNPSSVDGLAACSEAQIGLGTNDPVSCPDASKVGSLEIKTPLLEETMTGSVYLAEQGKNPFGSLLALYLVAEGPGVVVKIPGRIEADQATGQLTASFSEAPELPFESMSMKLKGGDRSPLLNPPACGTYQTTASFSSWSATDPKNPTPAETVTQTDSFQITQGAGGSPCGSGFKPKLTGGSATPIAGEYSPLALRVTREDGDQPLGSINATLPKGLLGKLAGVPYCPEAALAAISANEGTAAPQISNPSCPAASQIGTVTVGAGAGSNPFYLDTAKAYLAGPYKGAPLSLAVVAPVKAGPFDLGNQVVRNALAVDPVSAQVSAKSDPLPQILHGVPLDIRDVRVDLDKARFTLNPTSCDPTAIAGQVGSALGLTSNLSQRFQVGACKALDFGPSLALKVKGGMKRAQFPSLRVELRAKEGTANIGKASVALPHSEFLAQSHIKTICTRVQYAAKQCPAASVYGYARAWSPLLDQPLEGPVYLRSSSNPLPDLIASLDGQIHLDLAGRIDSKNGGLRTTFEGVPDAPVSKFVLTMQGGRKGLLENSRNLCAGANRATVRFDGQNGKLADSRPVVGSSCGKARKGGRKRK